MKHKIYVIRHQRPGSTVGNCVAKEEIRRTKLLYNRIRVLNIEKVITCEPNETKHIRPLQTASNLCSLMNVLLEVCKDVYMLPKIVNANILIVWHHADMEAIINHYGLENSFEWPEDDYDGCIIINNNGWQYQNNFFSREMNNTCLSILNMNF